MDYQELITIWNNSDDELAANARVNRKLVKEVAFKKIKSRLFEVKWTSFFELAVNFLWTPFLAGFVIDHLPDFRFFIPGLVLLALSVYSLLLNCYKLKLYFSIDTASSVLLTQQKLEQLKRLELLDIKSLYIIIPLFSAPFAVVIAKAFLHIDLFALGFFGKGLLYYTLGAVVIAIVIVFFLRRYPGKHWQESITFLRELKETEQS